MDKKETIHRQDNKGRTYQSNNTYKLRHSNEQSLINTMFGVAMRVYDSKGETFRWIKRIKPIEGKPELGETVLVLQQKQLDGWGNPYWKDVPIVEV